MHFQSPNRRYEHDSIRDFPRSSTFDVEELFHANVGTKTSLGDYVTLRADQLQGNFVGKDGRATVGDVGERTSMDHDRSAFQGLHESWFDSVLEKDHESSGNTLMEKLVKRGRKLGKLLTKSSAVTGWPFLSKATTISARRVLQSSRPVARARIAMISLATEMAKLVSLARPFSVADWPIVIFLRYRSLMSTTLVQTTLLGSMSKRAKHLFSASVKEFGSVLSIPSLLRRRSWIGENFRVPLMEGTRRS